MLSVQTIQMLLIGGVVGGVIGFLGAIPYLKKKGIDTEDVLKKTDVVLDGADVVIGIADKIMPMNPIVSILKIVDKYVHIGVSQAEQLYLTSLLPKDERNAKARETIYAALNLLKINRTPEMERIIDGAIETEVLALGHKEPSEAEKEVEKQALKTQVTQLTTERDTLKNTINTITTAASTAQVVIAQ